MKRMIDKLDQHYLLCGYGRVGRSAAAELSRSGVPFVVIDADAGKIESASKRGYLTMQADVSTDETLEEAHIGRARGLIAALATDAQNLFLVLSAKALNPRLKVASRVDEEGSEAKLRRAGADATFRPYNITGFRLAQAILRPHVSEFLEFTTSTVDLGLNIGIEQVQVSRQSELASKSLKDMQLRRDLGVIVLAVRRANGEMEFNPSADTVVNGDDFLVVMGDLKHMSQLQKLVAGTSS
jgi:voltage-gated potassium channel